MFILVAGRAITFLFRVCNLESYLNFYQYYRGNNYPVLGVEEHSKTQERMVVYRSVYNNRSSSLWMRSLSMFPKEVKIVGKMVPEFLYLEKTIQTEL